MRADPASWWSMYRRTSARRRHRPSLRTVAPGIIAIGASLGLLAGCATPPPAATELAEIPEFDGPRTAATATVPEAGSFLAIDEPMRDFVRTVLVPIADPVERLTRLTNYILGSGADGLRYDAGLTLTASETFAQRAGNCLSATGLIVVLAREAGLDAGFQDVPLLPSWQIAGTTFLVERHVNARVRVGPREFIVDFRPPESATYARLHGIEDGNAIAQYYGNLGVERFTAGDLGGAYRLYRQGLLVDRDSNALWINLGVVLVHNEQYADAELAYRNALVLDPENLSALNNLALLLQKRGETREARNLTARVERYRLHNPYFLYWRGDQRMRAGDYPAALQDFAAATRIEPREADFHFAMARAYRALGQYADADHSYEATLALAATTRIRDRYVDEYKAISRIP